jgi:hypothetical protein
LTPEGKYFYLFLMTNTKTTQCGIYEITIPQMVFETGYNEATVKKLIAQFEKAGKIRYSKDTSEIALKNWPKYNSSESPKVRVLVENELKSVKNRVLIQYLYSMDTPPQETETITEAKEETEPQAETAQTATAEVWPTFDDFWELYDKKTDRPKCELKWRKISHEAREEIMLHLDDYVKSTPDKKYRKNPATYLNNESWKNEIITTNGTRTNTNRKAEGVYRVVENIAQRYGSENTKP